MQSVISAIIALGALIFIHELGHFIFAKWFGVGVDKFSLGFGPKIIGKKIGETEYLLSAFPLGGYVKMVGEGEDAELTEEDKARSFAAKPPLQRIVIVAAGPLFNLLFAYFIFIIVYMVGVPAATTKIGEVVKDKPAARAGVQAKDMVTAINGKVVNRWEELSSTIIEGKGQPVELQVQREGKTLNFRITPEKRTAKNLLGDTVTTPVLGIVSAGEIVIDHFGPVDAFTKGSAQTWNVIKITVLSLVKLVERAIPLDTIGGPIMIVKMAGQQAAEGSVSFLAFVALLSVNLGILNLLPVPILDGGHLFFYLWEIVFRKPISPKAREIAQQIGLVLLISLMVLAFYNDIARYFIGQNQ
ncbi:membrane-associated zinc metalloprotease RseP [Geotalea daltonii FRC-32]|uniref:Zinc metalloprotease n=1 Tax=Geotalea daltonii (strain DSM 22248 / JCM 15807 / FRC-32) TaxID=316067 RepID=B9M5B9_GEODF|nr:RIP metalloprotease RseP [Geotalea daltonii]ACM19874.1 membrane-associated zinc metalloprotease RseP [Geotalea daltonii FRC-32]